MDEAPMPIYPQNTSCKVWGGVGRGWSCGGQGLGLEHHPSLRICRARPVLPSPLAAGVGVGWGGGGLGWGRPF